MSKDKRWIKIPDAGSKPGTGLWRDYDEMSHEWGKSKAETEVQWQALQVSKYLPTQISMEKPSEKDHKFVGQVISANRQWIAEGKPLSNQG